MHPKYALSSWKFQTASLSSRNAQQARISHSFWLCSSGTFRRWFCIRYEEGRNASAYENDVRSYPPIEDDLCRSRGRCTRDALLSCTSPALPPPSRIDRYYFRPVHDTRWIHNALPRARRNASTIIMPMHFVHGAMHVSLVSLFLQTPILKIKNY